MQDLLIRIEAEDYERWLQVHSEFAEMRCDYGIVDGPVYRDIDDPNAALFHVRVESMPRAMEYFGCPAFRNATARATIVRREFYLAEKQR